MISYFKLKSYLSYPSQIIMVEEMEAVLRLPKRLYLFLLTRYLSLEHKCGKEWTILIKGDSSLGKFLQ